MLRQVYFKNHLSEKLSGILHLPDRSTGRGAVIGHCFTCSRNTRILQQISLELAKAGFMTLRFDFSGNGQSEGDFAESSYTKHISEMKTAVDFLSGEGASKIALAGHSMGAAIAILTAAQFQPSKTVCSLAGRLSSTNASHFLNAHQTNELNQTGRVSFTSRGRSLELLKGFFADAEQHDLPKQIAALKSKILVVHGDQDEIVPVEEAFFARQLNPDSIDLAIIPGADHMFSQENHRRQVAALVVDWFSKYINETG